MDAMETSPLKEHYICRTCKVKFTDLTIFRNHYRSEWHRYNMHMTVNELSPITLEDFQKKEAMYRENNTSQTEKKQMCDVCRKKFSNRKQYENHLASKAHKKKLEQKDETIIFNKKSISIEDMSYKNEVDISSKNKEDISNENEEEIETDSDVESLESEEWIKESKYLAYEYNNCLFCNRRSKSVMCILKHMMKKHSFFIPDLEFCVDPSGLLEYLELKICTAHKCIWCNDSGR